MQKELINRRLISFLVILVLIPLTISLGIFVLGDRKYYFISLLIIIFSMIPFFMLFERKKTKTREVVLIAVLVAIAVVGRMAFFMIPQFKPVMAIVIVAGVCFGGEAGFLTGALAAFVSNFFFGQGPWTPWQMFAFGLVGFLAGVIFSKSRLKEKRWLLCLFGGVATLVIYGGLINLSTLFMTMQKVTLGAVLAVYASGFYFDLVHGASTVIFLAFIYRPMMGKVERIKVKYGF
jgi:energy-coupling factor transport system substrate-specific component